MTGLNTPARPLETVRAELVEARRFRTAPSASSGQTLRNMNNLNNAASFDKAQDERLSIGFPFTLSQVEVSGHAEPSRSMNALRRAGEGFISADADLVEARRFRTVPSASSGQARRNINNLNNAASFDKAQDERLSIGFPFTLSQVEVSGHAEPSRSTTHLKYPQFEALPKRVFSWFQA